MKSLHNLHIIALHYSVKRICYLMIHLLCSVLPIVYNENVHLLEVFWITASRVCVLTGKC